MRERPRVSVRVTERVSVAERLGSFVEACVPLFKKITGDADELALLDAERDDEAVGDWLLVGAPLRVCDDV